MKKCISTVCILLLCATLPLSARTPYRGDVRDDEEGTTVDVMAELVSMAIIAIGASWAVFNVGITYDDYPYANGQYVSNSVLFHETGKQSYRFTVETGAYYFPKQKLVGNQTRLEGYIWRFWGPVFENTVFTDADTRGPSGIVRLGGELSLFHTNILSLDGVFQWAHSYGRENEFGKDRNGYVLGLTARSYPIKPFLLEWRGSWQHLYGLPGYFFESHLEAGMMLNDSPFEIFAAWKYTRNNVWAKEESESHNGVSTGIKFHF